MKSADEPPFVSRYFRSADGLRLYYRDYAGPKDAPFPVICLPGLTRNARDFEGLAPRLAARYRVLCLDFRGRGRSEYAAEPMTYVPRSYVRDLAAFFRAVRCRRAALIGTSLGGLVATVFTAVHPQKVLGLVLNDVGPEIDPVGLARISGYVGKIGPVESWRDAAEAVERLDRCVYPDYGAEDWLRTARRRYTEDDDGRLRLDYDLTIAKAFATPAATPEQWPFFRRLKRVPTLALRGAASDILARETVKRMQAEAPALEVVEIPDRGHTPSLDEPAACAAIMNFLSRLPSRLAPTSLAARMLAGWAFRPTARRAGVF